MLLVKLKSHKAGSHMYSVLNVVTVKLYKAGSHMYSVLNVVTVKLCIYLGYYNVLPVFYKHVLCHLALHCGKNRFRLKPPVPGSNPGNSLP